MNLYEWRVVVVTSVALQTVEIFVYRALSRDEKEFLIKGGAESVISDNKTASEDGLCFAQLPDEGVASLLLEALEKKGVRLPSKDHTSGKLEATEKHLEDMRRLVFSEPVVTQVVQERQH